MQKTASLFLSDGNVASRWAVFYYWIPQLTMYWIHAFYLTHKQFSGAFYGLKCINMCIAELFGPCHFNSPSLLETKFPIPLIPHVLNLAWRLISSIFNHHSIVQQIGAQWDIPPEHFFFLFTAKLYAQTAPIFNCYWTYRLCLKYVFSFLLSFTEIISPKQRQN